MAKTPKKPVAKKTAAKKPAVKKPVAKKPAVKKTAAKKPVKTTEVQPKAIDENDGIHWAARPFLWLGDHRVEKGFMWLILLLLIPFIAADFFIHRHGHFSWEIRHGFYAVFGFLAFSFVVFMGWPLRKLTGRSEDYYQDGEPDE